MYFEKTFGNLFIKSPIAIHILSFKSLPILSFSITSKIKSKFSLQNFELIHINLHKLKIATLYNSLFLSISLLLQVKLFFAIPTIKGIYIAIKFFFKISSSIIL